MGQIQSNELEHYGVLGMKWGVRRTPEQLGHAPKKKRPTKSQIEAKKKKDRKKAVKNRRILSDKELKERIERLEKEKRLKDLTDDDINAGKKFAREILKKVGTAAAVGATAYGLHTVIRNTPAVKQMMKEIAKAKAPVGSTVKKTAKQIMNDVDWKTLANYMAPNPKKK